MVRRGDPGVSPFIAKQVTHAASNKTRNSTRLQHKRPTTRPERRVDHRPRGRTHWTAPVASPIGCAEQQHPPHPLVTTAVHRGGYDPARAGEPARSAVGVGLDLRRQLLQ
ncbi:hypothetical protein MTO96_010030 [Rhipicephalus appendiculatus]